MSTFRLNEIDHRSLDYKERVTDPRQLSELELQIVAYAEANFCLSELCEPKDHNEIGFRVEEYWVPKPDVLGMAKSLLAQNGGGCSKAIPLKEGGGAAVAGYCKDCRRWDSGDETCNIDQMDRKSEIGRTEFAIYAEAKDDHGLRSGLKTGPMFGCMGFISRQENKHG